MSTKKGLDAPTSKPGENTNLRAAIAYSQMLGWKVFPIHYKSKTPITQHGFKDATDNEKQIRDWWSLYPDAGIGLPTGEINNVIVLDIDPRNNGHFSFDRLIDEYGNIPDTVECLTGGDGNHIYFNYSNKVKKSKISGYEGIDIQGNGKYVVLPPSTHPSGKKYHWEESSKPVVTPIRDIPEWLLGMVLIPEGKEHQRKTSSYWVRLMKGFKEHEGRNNAATSLAGYLFRRYIEPELVVEIMNIWNERNDPPLETEELNTVIESIANKELARRRGGSH